MVKTKVLVVQWGGDEGPGDPVVQWGEDDGPGGPVW